MATIKIDDSKPFPGILTESDNKRESALDFFKRQSVGLPLVSDDMELEKKEQEKLREFLAKQNVSNASTNCSTIIFA